MQKKTFSTVLAVALSAAVFMLAGCGSSGKPASPTVSGIAATGKAIVGNVRLKDSSSPSRELTAATGTDGSYVINVAGLTPPFLVKADWTEEDTTGAAVTKSLVSFAASVGTANINPLSNAIVANAAGVDDPVALYDAPTPATQNKIAAAIGTATSSMVTQLKPLLAAYGTTIDPITGAFVANHTGMDAMFDAVTITINNGTLTVNNSSAGSTIFTAPVTQLAGGVFTAANMPMASPSQAQPGIDGAALYASNCAGCHGGLAKSTKQGASVARIQSAISAGMGGMGSLSSLSSQEIQAIAAALGNSAATTPTTGTTGTTTPAPGTPVPAPPAPASADGAALYANNCAGCHGALATSTKKGITVTRLQSAINGDMGGMGGLSLSQADMQAIVNALSNPTTGSTGSPAPSPAPAPSPTPPAVDGATLYATNCAGCHGALATSSKQGVTLARLQAAISGNIGGMGFLSSLGAADQQAIVNALAAPAPAPTPTPVPAPAPSPTPAPVDGASLYATNCAGCHGVLANSTKKGITLTRLQSAISGNIGGMGSLSSLTTAEQQAIVTVLTVVTPAPAPTPTPTPTPNPTPVPIDGAALYTSSCAGCHGPLATSAKQGITLARLQAAISGNVGGMGYLSTLTAAQQQAIVTALAVTTPTPTPSPTPTPAPAPDGATLYGTNCAGCHGPLATSAKAGATATRIQTAIAGNVGGMGYLSTLTATDIQAIATALATVTPPTTPAPTPACGSCHAIPPATGRHTLHLSRATCATCHGTGYSTTTVNAATHNNGVKNVTTTIGWNATTRTCSNSCHGTEQW